MSKQYTIFTTETIERGYRITTEKTREELSAEIHKVEQEGKIQEFLAANCEKSYETYEKESFWYFQEDKQ